MNTQYGWHWSVAQCQLFHAQLSLVVAPTPWTAEPVATNPFLQDQNAWSSPPVSFPAAICAFFHSLRVGAPWAHALDLFAGLPDGNLSADGRVFATPALRGPGGAPDRRVVLSEPDSADAPVPLFFPGRPRRRSLLPLLPAPPIPGPLRGPDRLCAGHNLSVPLPSPVH